MTVTSNKTGKVILACEGITVPGDMCDGSVEVPLPGKDPETKMPYSKAKRATLARKKVQEKGWRLTKGADECPRVHGAVPVPLKAKERVGDGEPPCPRDAQPGHDRTGIVTNQPGAYDKTRPHASVEVCGSPSCRAASMGWVYKQTGEHGVYVSDSARIGRAA